MAYFPELMNPGSTAFPQLQSSMSHLSRALTCGLSDRADSFPGHPPICFQKNCKCGKLHLVHVQPSLPSAAVGAEDGRVRDKEASTQNSLAQEESEKLIVSRHQSVPKEPIWRETLKQKLELKQKFGGFNEPDSGNESGLSQQMDESNEGSRGSSASPKSNKGQTGNGNTVPAPPSDAEIDVVSNGSSSSNSSTQAAPPPAKSAFSVSHLLKPVPESPYLLPGTFSSLFPANATAAFSFNPIGHFLNPMSAVPSLFCPLPTGFPFFPQNPPATQAEPMMSRFGTGPPPTQPLQVHVPQPRRPSPPMHSSNSNSPDLRNFQLEHSPSSNESQSSSPCLSSTSASLPSSGNGICVVCEDKASGFHYNVISCEGCKGFFRRTVQKRIEYPCHKDKKCIINRITRNRCQACRFAKCLQMGMAKESVRQDGNRKRKAGDSKNEEELQATARLQSIIKTLLAAYLNTFPDFQVETDLMNPSTFISQQFQDSPSKVEKFARQVPGFAALKEEDQATLIKAATAEIMLLRCAFAIHNHSVSDKREVGELRGADRDVADYVVRLRDSLDQLNVFNEEMALLSGLSLLTTTRTGIREPEQVEQLQEPLLEALRVQVQLRRPQHQNHFAKLLMKISDLRSAACKYFL